MKKLSYSFLAFSLSCLGIPLYIHLAAFYFNQYQISLSLIGLTIFICRTFDCIFDPLSGFISDKLIAKRVGRAAIILFSAIPLFINFYFLFNPFYQGEKQLIYWLGGNLLLLYFFLSFVSVNYEAMVGDFKEKQSDFIANREFMQIIGILTISILPSIISQKLQISYDQSLSYLWIFILPFFALGVLFLFNLKTISAAPLPLPLSQRDTPLLPLSLSQRVGVRGNLKNLKPLFLTHLLNSIAVSIPAVAIRFYVDEHLKTPNLNGHFLGLYFLSAAISVFIWTKIINKIGAKKSWQSAILLSVAIFIFATFITSQNYYLFYAICLLSGFAVGCDLTAPQLILINKIQNQENKTSYFAIFSLITKISLAIASLLVLNLITKNGAINYEAIPYVYALLPCFLKILTILFLKKL